MQQLFFYNLIYNAYKEIKLNIISEGDDFMKKRTLVILIVAVAAISVFAGALGTGLLYKIKEHKKSAAPIVTNHGVSAPNNQALTNPEAFPNAKTEPEQKPKDNPDASSFISAEKAKQIALDRAGISAEGAYFDRVELERDNGIWHYDIEFKKDHIEYDAEISATDGKILKWESERD